MVCWEINLVTVEFRVRNIDFLTTALQRLNIRFSIQNNIVYAGYTTINLNNQTIETTDYNMANKLKREYSKVVVEEIAKKKKWAIKQLSANKVRLRRF